MTTCCAVTSGVNAPGAPPPSAHATRQGQGQADTRPLPGCYTRGAWLRLHRDTGASSLHQQTFYPARLGTVFHLAGTTPLYSHSLLQRRSVGCAVKFPRRCERHLRPAVDERWSLNNEESLAATVSALLSASLTVLLQIHEFLPQLSLSSFFLFSFCFVFAVNFWELSLLGSKSHWSAEIRNLTTGMCSTIDYNEGHNGLQQLAGRGRSNCDQNEGFREISRDAEVVVFVTVT